MKLDSLDLATTTISATIKNIKPSKKMTVYEYPWSDNNYVEESGKGVRGLTVTGVVSGTTDRDAIEQACESTGEKKLYFPSIIGADDDRYYKVYTETAVFTPGSATLYQYSFECVCVDTAVYDSETDTALW